MSEEPIFRVFVDNQLVATLFDPRFEDMFWCSYRVEPVDAVGDQIIHSGKVWESVGFVVRDLKGTISNPYTFSGYFDDFVARLTDRLSFRSLWPPT